MNLQQETTIIRCLYEDVLNAGDIDLARELIAVGAIDHDPRATSSLPISSTEAIGVFLDEMCTAFPDVHWAIEMITPHEDTLVVRTTVSGSHHAEFRGLRATGKEFILQGVDTLRVSQGQVVEHWGSVDIEALREQLGAVRDVLGMGGIGCSLHGQRVWRCGQQLYSRSSRAPPVLDALLLLLHAGDPQPMAAVIA